MTTITAKAFIKRDEWRYLSRCPERLQDAIMLHKQHMAHTLANSLMKAFADDVRQERDVETGGLRLELTLTLTSEAEIARRVTDAECRAQREQARVDAERMPYGLDEVYE